MKFDSAGPASTLPTGSVARTWKRCEPSASAALVKGLEQAANGSESRRQAKVASASLAAKVMLGVLSAVVAGGPAVIEVTGAVVSTVKLDSAGV